MEKIALFVFNGDPMCFIHVLLNALDFRDRGADARVVVEGAATRLVPDLSDPGHFLHGLWEKVRSSGSIDGVCKACSAKMGTLEAAKSQGLRLLDDMSGHPSMARYHREGFTIITF